MASEDANAFFDFRDGSFNGRAERRADHCVEKGISAHRDASVYPEYAIPERVHGFETQFVNDITGHKQASGQSNSKACDVEE